MWTPEGEGNRLPHDDRTLPFGTAGLASGVACGRVVHLVRAPCHYGAPAQGHPPGYPGARGTRQPRHARGRWPPIRALARWRAEKHEGVVRLATHRPSYLIVRSLSLSTVALIHSATSSNRAARISAHRPGHDSDRKSTRLNSSHA